MFELWDRSFALERALPVYMPEAQVSDWDEMRPRNRKKNLWRRNGR